MGNFVFKQEQIDELLNYTGEEGSGSTLDRAQFQSWIADLNMGFFIAKTDPEPTVDIDAARHAILFGPGGASPVDVMLIRPASDRLEARNAGGALYRNVRGADPIDPNDFVTLGFAGASFATTAANPLPGAVTVWAGGVEPPGWMFCDGRSLDTTTYADLFAVIGYTYGGSGANFNIPDTNLQATRWDGMEAIIRVLGP